MKTERRNRTMDKEEKLRYTLFELNGHLVFSIFYMDERFRAQDKLLRFTASNGWKVMSCMYPMIRPKEKEIYLQGQDFKDDRKVCVKELYTEDVSEIIIQIHSALREWAGGWKGWKEEQPKSRSSSNFPTFFC